MLRSRRGSLRSLPREDPELARSEGSMDVAEACRLARRQGRYSKDVAEACHLAKTMQVPVAEMQRSYALFQDHAELLAPGAEMLRDGRLGQEQFAKLVRNNLISDSDVLAEQCINKVAGCVKRVCKSAGVDQDRALSFEEFVECMRILSFDYAFNVTHEGRERGWGHLFLLFLLLPLSSDRRLSGLGGVRPEEAGAPSGGMLAPTRAASVPIRAEERELHRMAQKYNLDPVEVDRYKKMFDELDENGSGKIENQEFENLLYKCGNIARDIGLSDARRHSLWLLTDPSYDGSIDFEEFLIFSLNYLAQEADALVSGRWYFGRCVARSPKGLQACPIPGEASAREHKRVGAGHCAYMAYGVLDV
jgi:hypothetical protein